MIETDVLVQAFELPLSLTNCYFSASAAIRAILDQTWYSVPEFAPRYSHEDDEFLALSWPKLDQGFAGAIYCDSSDRCLGRTKISHLVPYTAIHAKLSENFQF